MIVRIATEGQYRVESTTLDRLDEIDELLIEAVRDGDDEAFSRLLADMAELVRRQGALVPPGDIVESDLVLPPSDTSLDEARRLFEVDGLITRT